MGSGKENRIPNSPLWKPKAGACYLNGWRQMWKYVLELLLISVVAALMHLPIGAIEALAASGDIWPRELVSVFSVAYLLLIIWPIEYGVDFVYLKAARGDKVEFRHLFTALQNYLNVVLAHILAVSIIIIGIVFLVVPGIFLACRLAFTPYLVIDRKMAAVAAVKESWRLTKGYAFRVFLLALLALPIALAGLICFGVGLLASLMWIGLAFASLYHTISVSKGLPPGHDGEIELDKSTVERLQQELEDARQMQLSLLPESAPVIEGFAIAGFSRPAREVGGDFFDYLSLADGNIGIALADISGKGLKGAMNAALTNGMLKEVTRNEVSCGAILSVLNTGLCSSLEKQVFAALGIAILHQDGVTLQWASAGQPYPLVKRGKRVFELESDNGLPLGMVQDTSYPERELILQADDVIIFYTDGVIEAENEAEQLYGIDRLKQSVSHLSSAMSVAQIIETILQDVTDFAATMEQYDDMTVVVVKRCQVNQI